MDERRPHRLCAAPCGAHGGIRRRRQRQPRSTELNAVEGELEHGWPHALPDGSIVFTVSQRGRDPHVEVLSVKGQRTRLRVPIIGQAQFVETGHLVYSFLGNLMAVKFSLDEGAIDGVPAAIAKGIQTSNGFGTLGRSGFAVSRTGTLVWLRAGPTKGRASLSGLSAAGKCRRSRRRPTRCRRRGCRPMGAGSPSSPGPAS